MWFLKNLLFLLLLIIIIKILWRSFQILSNTYHFWTESTSFYDIEVNQSALSANSWCFIGMMIDVS